VTASQSPEVTEQVEAFMRTLPQYPGRPTRPIVDAVDVLAETGPTLGRPLVDRIEQNTLMTFTGGAPSIPFGSSAVEDSKPCKALPSIAG
jgi:hypothetical protein